MSDMQIYILEKLKEYYKYPETHLDSFMGAYNFVRWMTGMTDEELQEALNFRKNIFDLKGGSHEDK